MAFFSRLFRYLRDIRVEACNSGAEFEREIKKERKKEIPYMVLRTTMFCELE